MFAELADQFDPLVDVLGEVSERTRAVGRSNDLLRLYERWLRTGSARSGQRLIEQGDSAGSSVEPASSNKAPALLGGC